MPASDNNKRATIVSASRSGGSVAQRKNPPRGAGQVTSLPNSPLSALTMTSRLCW